MPTEKELQGLREALTPYFQTTDKKKGGKSMSDEPMTKIEFKISELEKAVKEATTAAERYRGELEKVITGHPEPEETIKHWLECPNCRPRFESLMKPQLDEAYSKGKADAKQNITPDDLNINLVGEYFRQRGILGVAKQDGKFTPFKKIQVGGK